MEKLRGLKPETDCKRMHTVFLAFFFDLTSLSDVRNRCMLMSLPGVLS